MIWHFYMIDRNGAEHAIDNPVGWDGTSFEIKRDEQKHGMFFEYQGNEYEYHGKAAQLLRQEYEAYGLQGKMSLRIALDSGMEQEDLGTFDFVFADWEDSFGGDDFVKISVEERSGLMTFKNRMEQKVDLRTTTSFEGTALPAYGKLPFTSVLPAKGIFVEDYALHENTSTEAYQPTTTPLVNPGVNMGQMECAFIVPSFDKNVSDDIGGFYPPNDTTYSFNEGRETWTSAPADSDKLPYEQVVGFSTYGIDTVNLDMLQPIISYDAEFGKTYGVQPFTNLTLYIEYSGSVYTRHNSNNPITTGLRGWGFYLCKRNRSGHVTWHSQNTATWAVWQPNLGEPPLPEGTGTAKQWLIENLSLELGDKIYYFYGLVYYRYGDYVSEAPFDITYDAGCMFKLSGMSKLPDTQSKLFAVNESLSRITEAITNDKMRVFSNYFGRTDSLPYAALTDGCGSLATVTKGLFVRRMEDKLADRPTIFSLSMKDMWDGLNPIHNLGMGIERDTGRTGDYYRVRIEPWRYFYQISVLFTCQGVQKLRRTIVAGKHYGIFKFGYAKWEAEEYNGIDEFLTSREYRTSVVNDSVLEQKSAFIASGFALEITRRKDTSEDWRYDNDTFIICMKRQGGSLVPEIGNITGSNTTILDASTIYNWRIRPLYNAMRWMPQVLGAYRNANNYSPMIFTAGDGNIYATGQITGGGCVLSDDNLSEKATLTPSVLNNPADGLPLFRNEEVSFDYPLTLGQYKLIQAAPYGRIAFTTDGFEGSGWIKKVVYKPEQGMGSFVVVPGV